MWLCDLYGNDYVVFSMISEEIVEWNWVFDVFSVCSDVLGEVKK